MQIVGRSLVPTTSLPYTHLGYLSATRPSALTTNFLIIGFVLSIAGLVIAVRHGRNLRKPAFVTGLLLLTLGVLMVIFAKQQPPRLVHAGSITGKEMYAIAYDIVKLQQKGKPVPDTVEAVEALFERRYGVRKDGWFHPYQLRKETAGKKLIYKVVSAGPDSRFDTPDDMSQSTTAVEDDVFTDETKKNLRLLLTRVKTAEPSNEPVWHNAGQLRDGWNRPLTLRRLAGRDSVRYKAISAGPDGKIGNADDVTLYSDDM